MFGFINTVFMLSPHTLWLVIDVPMRPKIFIIACDRPTTAAVWRNRKTHRQNRPQTTFPTRFCETIRAFNYAHYSSRNWTSCGFWSESMTKVKRPFDWSDFFDNFLFLFLFCFVFLMYYFFLIKMDNAFECLFFSCFLVECKLQRV